MDAIGQSAFIQYFQSFAWYTPDTGKGIFTKQPVAGTNNEMSIMFATAMEKRLVYFSMLHRVIVDCIYLIKWRTGW